MFDIRNSDKLFSFLNTDKKLRKKIKNIFINLDYDFLNNQFQFNNIKLDNQKLSDQSLEIINGFNNFSFKNSYKNRLLLNKLLSFYEG